jgi:hypothetical protein
MAIKHTFYSDTVHKILEVSLWVFEKSYNFFHSEYDAFTPVEITFEPSRSCIFRETCMMRIRPFFRHVVLEY